MLGTESCIIPARAWGEVPAPFVWDMGLWRKDEFIVDFEAEGHHYGSQPLKPWPDLMFACPVDLATGYGMASGALIWHLGRKCREALPEQGTLALFRLAYWRKEWLSREVRAQLQNLAEPHEWAIVLAIPPEIPRVPAARRVAYTMWETDTLPDDPNRASEQWARLLNTWAEVVVVPCQVQKDLFLHGGVTVPVHVVPLGLDVGVFQYRERPPQRKFVIVSHGTLTSRKSPVETLTRVCWAALGDKEDWLLILKTRGGQLGGGKFTPIINDDRVVVINRDLSPDGLARLLQHASLGMYLSRWEGWGLAPREAMATGLPVIWTATSGHLEDCDEGYNIPVPVVGKVPLGQYEGGVDEPDFAYAAEKLREEYDAWHKRGRGQSEMGTRAAAWIAGRRSWEKCASGLINVVQEANDGGSA